MTDDSRLSVPISDRPYEAEFPLDAKVTGTVHWVQLDIDTAAEDVDHLASEERLRAAMARQ